MRDDDDPIEPYPENLVAYPPAVKAAGIIWIIFGNLILINMLVFAVLMSMVARRDPASAAFGGMCGSLFIGVFGVAFIFVGVQSVRGTAPGTLGNATGSIVFSLLNLGYSVLQAEGGQVIQSGIALLAGAGLLAAGVLALIGRDQYKAWRRATQAQRPMRPGR